jgi:hypothetical protein
MTGTKKGASGALLHCDDSVLQSRFLRPVDRDAFGFRFFRHDAQQVDVQQTVAQVRPLQ